MLKLTDSELDIVMTAAAPLDPISRRSFLEVMAVELARHETFGDGVVFRVAREAQRRFFSPPLEAEAGHGRRRKVGKYA
jgi:hypothetical protein